MNGYPQSFAPTCDRGVPVDVRHDVQYATVGGQALALDLYLPRGTLGPAPAVAYAHGGGWVRGGKRDFAAQRLVPVASRGIAVASIDYRLSTTATWPAPLHDIKGALRWLRAHASELHIDPARISAWGASAGGHLAALLGLTGGNAELDGDTGGNVDQPSTVQSVVSWFPPVDLLSLTNQPPAPEKPLPPFLDGPLPTPTFEARLLGLSDVRDAPQMAAAASPLTYADRDAPPFLLLHGDRDGLIPDDQSRLLHRKLLAHGNDAQLLLLADANHEDPAFHRAEVIAAVAGFLTHPSAD